MAKTETRRINIWINGKEVQNNIKDITASYKKLIAEQAHMTVGSKEYMAHATKIKHLKGVIDDHKRQIGSIATAWQKAKDTIVATGFGVLGGNLLTALSTRIGGFFSNIINGAAKMSDQFADIRKTTGMTMEEVEALSGSLSKIDTRTSTNDLRQIAIVAGQLGIAKEDVLGFVDAVDKTAVALGDEFTGGAEEVATVVGKLRNVFTDMQSANVGEDIMHISNALNELGASGFATAPVVSDFAGRIGGVGITLGLTTGQVLGLSATLQELNVSTERGGTAVVKILQKMTTETDKFAVVAGMNVTDFKNLVNTDLYGAFTKVVEGSRQSGSSATALAGIIKDLEVQGAGASEVFAKLGSNVSMMNEKVDLASNSLKSTDSILAEFNLKNDNLAGQWEKAKKSLTAIVMGIGKHLAPAILSLVKGFVNLLEWIKRNSQAFVTLGKLIVTAVTAWASYNLAMKLAVLWSNKFYIAKMREIIAEKAQQLATKLGTALLYLRLLAYDVYTKKISLATAATEAFNMVSKGGGFGLIVAGITTAITAFALFNKETSRTEKLQKDITKAIAKEKGELASLSQRLLDTNTDQAEKARLMGIINEKYGEYMPKLLNEKMSNEELAAALSSVNDQLERKVLLEMRDAMNNELMVKKMETQMERIKAQQKYEEARDEAARLQREHATIGAWQSAYDQRVAWGNKADKLLKEEKEIQKEIDEANAIIDQMLADMPGAKKSMYGGSFKGAPTPTNTEPPITVTGGTSTDSAAEEKKVNEYLKVYEDLRGKIKDTFSKMRLDRLSDEEKEMQQVRDKYDEMISINQMAQIEIAAKGKNATEDEIATAKALASQLIDLENLKQAEITAVTDKYEKLRLEKKADVQEQIDLILMNDEQKEIHDVTKKYMDLIKLAEEYGIDTVALYKKMQEELDALKNKGKVNTDVFGMTPTDWENTKDEFSKLIGYAQKFAEVVSKITELENSRDQKRLDHMESHYSKESENLEKLYENKNISERTYLKKKEQLDSSYDENRTAIERKMNNRKRESAKFEALVNMAAAIAEALPNPIMVAFATTLGLAQIAAIEQADEPFMLGGYTAKASSNSIPVGKVHANEWVSPAWMVKDPVTGPMISQLEAIRASGNARRSVSVPQSQRNMAQQSSADINSATLNGIYAEMAALRILMSDPVNRRAYIVHDELKRYESDLMNVQKLRKIA